MKSSFSPLSKDGGQCFFLNKSVQNKIQKIIKIARSAIFFWTWAILFWTRKPRSGFGIIFWIIFWRSPEKSEYFFEGVFKILFLTCSEAWNRSKTKKNNVKKRIKSQIFLWRRQKTLIYGTFRWKSELFFEHGQFFFEHENREAVFEFFFELFFECREAAIFFLNTSQILKKNTVPYR